MKLFSSFVKYYFTLTILSFCIVCKGQQYSFLVYFEDAIGNKDTLVIGFDVEATHEVDTAFQEINLLGTSLDTAFNVVFSDKNFKPKEGYESTTPITYQLKKQIVPREDISDIDYLSSIVEIDVTCDHWPLKISWDSTLLKADFLHNVILTAYYSPSNWFDGGSYSGDGLVHRMMDISSVVYNQGDLCVDRDSTLFLYIGWYDLISSATSDVVENTVDIYPNPVNQTMIVTLDNQKMIDKISVVNLLGVSIMQFDGVNQKEVALDVSSLEKGMYQLIVVNNQGTSSSRLIKKM